MGEAAEAKGREELLAAAQLWGHCRLCLSAQSRAQGAAVYLTKTWGVILQFCECFMS